MLKVLQEKNPDFTIYSIFDEAFRLFGRVLSLDTAGIIAAANAIEMPGEGASYVPTEPTFEALPIAKDIADNYFGQMPVQVGFCWGHSNFLNAVEWHTSTEINVAVTPLVLLLGRLQDVIQKGLQKSREQVTATVNTGKTLSKVCIVGEAPRTFAETVSDDITVLPLSDAATLAENITRMQPNAVIWGSDALSKKLSAQVSAMLGLGLCADCTMLETDGEQLYMYRPALSGSVIAKIVSRTVPAMATVRTTENTADIVVAAGFGVKDHLDVVNAFTEKLCGGAGDYPKNGG